MFDGELVMDTYCKSGTKEKYSVYKYLIFDTLIAKHEFVYKAHYELRMDHAMKFRQDIKFCLSIDPARMSYGPEIDASQLIKVQVKDFFRVDNIDQILFVYKYFLPHENDGLIFTRYTPYKSMTNMDIIKWKPPEQNSIDFILYPLVNTESFLLEVKTLVYAQEGEKKFLLYDILSTTKELFERVQNEIKALKDQTDQPVEGVVAECVFTKLQPAESEALYNFYKSL